MKVFCESCGAVGVADAQYELIGFGWTFIDPDDLESAGWCPECSRMRPQRWRIQRTPRLKHVDQHQKETLWSSPYNTTVYAMVGDTNPRREAIKKAVYEECDHFAPGEWCEDEHTMSVWGTGPLYDGETEEHFARRIAAAIWRGNGESCCVCVRPVCVQDTPSYDYDDGHYAQWTQDAEGFSDTEEYGGYMQS